MNIYWEADKYTENFSFVHHYGEDLFGLINAPKGEKPLTIVDLGCGNGALTKKLSDAGYAVIGIDDSEEMLAAARKLHPDLDFQKGNAMDFTLAEDVDVIFSNAVLHWINAADQEKTAENIFARLKPNGQFICEFGGKGCAEAVHGTLEAIFKERGLVYPRIFYFPTIGEYVPILEKTGFRVEYARLFDRPTSQKGERGLREWIEMFVKKPFETVSAADKTAILDEAEKRLKGILLRDNVWIIDYVRIRIRAVKPSAGK